MAEVFIEEIADKYSFKMDPNPDILPNYGLATVTRRRGSWD